MHRSFVSIRELLAALIVAMVGLNAAPAEAAASDGSRMRLVDVTVDPTAVEVEAETQTYSHRAVL